MFQSVFVLRTHESVGSRMRIVQTAYELDQRPPAPKGFQTPFRAAVLKIKSLDQKLPVGALEVNLHLRLWQADSVMTAT